MSQLRTDKGAFDGPRDFVYVKPTGRRLTEYEALNIFVQPIQGDTPHPVAKTAGWSQDSTELRATDWYAFRDPAQMWQRPYTKRQAEQERAIERSMATSRAGGLLKRIDEHWAAKVLGDLYVPWAFFEHGLFRALSHCSLVALSDVVSVALVFNAFDKERHAQDIMFHQYDLVAAGIPVGDDDRRSLWLDAPAFQPARSLVEHLNGTADWGEVLMAINLLIEPLLGRFVCNEVLWVGSPLSGDFVTPVVLAEADNDRQRNLTWTNALVQMLADDAINGDRNLDTINRWLAAWFPEVSAALTSLRPLADNAGGDVAGGLATVESAWRALLETHNLSAPGGLCDG